MSLNLTQDSYCRSNTFGRNTYKNSLHFLEKGQIYFSHGSYMSQVKEESKSEVRPLHHRVGAVPLHGHPPDGRLLQLDHDLQVSPT